MRSPLRPFALLPLLCLLAPACAATSADGEGESSGSALSAAAAQAAASTTRTALLANNTSASSLFRDEYTPARRFNGANIGVVSNGDNPAAPTVSTTFADGAVSKLSLRSLLPAGSSTKVFVETQSWFCTNGNAPLSSALDADQCGSHVDIGYDANSTAHVQKQVSDMQSRGIDGVIVDWDGPDAGKGALDQKSKSTGAINAGTLFGFKAAAEASHGTFEFAVQEDEGMKTCAGDSKCDINARIIHDLTFVATSFFGSPGYMRAGGRPVVFFFGVDYALNHHKANDTTDKRTIEWTTIQAAIPENPIFVFENRGGFTHPASGGAYGWADTQDPVTDPFGTKTYLPKFYEDGAQYSSKLAFGSVFKGFNDHIVNSWNGSGNGERFVGQQCGKTWLDTFAIASAHAKGLHAIELVTWDDYEEGTELESGIDNHLEVTATVNGSTLDWSTGLDASAPKDCTQAVAGGFDVANTVHHFSVYASPASDGENLTLIADALTPDTRSLDLGGKLGAGAWKLYVRAVAKPSITNKLSAAVTANGGGTGGKDAGTGGGCSGEPTILEPTNGERVGPSIHLRATAPTCIDSMIAYVDGKQVGAVKSNGFDAWVPVSMGKHTVNVNGWGASSATAHTSIAVPFERTY